MLKLYFAETVVRELKKNAIDFLNNNITIDNTKKEIEILEWLNWFDKNNSFISNYITYKE